MSGVDVSYGLSDEIRLLREAIADARELLLGGACSHSAVVEADEILQAALMDAGQVFERRVANLKETLSDCLGNLDAGMSDTRAIARRARAALEDGP